MKLVNGIVGEYICYNVFCWNSRGVHLLVVVFSYKKERTIHVYALESLGFHGQEPLQQFFHLHYPEWTLNQYQ
jgi:hypothetical protein